MSVDEPYRMATKPLTYLGRRIPSFATSFELVAPLSANEVECGYEEREHDGHGVTDGDKHQCRARFENDVLGFIGLDGLGGQRGGASDVGFLFVARQQVAARPAVALVTRELHTCSTALREAAETTTFGHAQNSVFITEDEAAVDFEQSLRRVDARG